MPTLSVILPAYNAEKFIGEAIQSVLDQTYRDFELIVINDGSTDKTGEIIQKFADLDNRIICINNEKNINIARSRNVGVKLARGEFIATMDADDICLPDRFENQINLLKSNLDISIVIGDLLVMDEEGVDKYIRKYPKTDTELKKKLFRFNPFPNPTTMVKKVVYMEVGEYEHKYVPIDDFDFWIRAGTTFKFQNTCVPVLRYRVSSKSSSHSKLRKVELLTYKLRYKALKLGYKPSILDIVLNIVQLVSFFLLPQVVKIALFNFLRKYKII